MLVVKRRPRTWRHPATRARSAGGPTFSLPPHGDIMKRWSLTWGNGDLIAVSSSTRIPAIVTERPLTQCPEICIHRTARIRVQLECKAFQGCTMQSAHRISNWLSTSQLDCQSGCGAFRCTDRLEAWDRHTPRYMHCVK